MQELLQEDEHGAARLPRSRLLPEQEDMAQGTEGGGAGDDGAGGGAESNYEHYCWPQVSRYNNRDTCELDV